MTKKALSGRALLLSRMDVEDLVRLVNADSIKRYYASRSIIITIIKFGHEFSL